MRWAAVESRLRELLARPAGSLRPAGLQDSGKRQYMESMMDRAARVTKARVQVAVLLLRLFQTRSGSDDAAHDLTYHLAWFDRVRNHVVHTWSDEPGRGEVAQNSSIPCAPTEWNIISRVTSMNFFVS